MLYLCNTPKTIGKRDGRILHVFLASLRKKKKNAVFAIIAIWWGRGGYGYIWGGWRMGEKYFSMPTY